MKSILVSLLIALSIPTTVCADYDVRYLGSFVSDNEELIDASRNGWLLILSHDAYDCPIRAKIGSQAIVRLCDRGLETAIKVNAKGAVLGITQGTGELAVWSEAGGLKNLEIPSEPHDELHAADFNDRGEVVGYTKKVILDQDDEYVDTHYQAYRWSPDRQAHKINFGPNRSSQAVAINGKGEIVVFTEAHDSYTRRATYVGRTHFKRIDKRGQGIGGTDADVWSINNHGQVAHLGGYSAAASIYSPNSGWRDVPMATPLCTRCGDTGYGQVALSESGKAIFSVVETAIVEYPNDANLLVCVVPQNRQIQNAGTPSLLVRDFDEYITAHRFLRDGKIVVSTNVSGDGKGEQLFLFEPRASVDPTIDYCPKVDLEFSRDTEDFCGYSPYDYNVRSCAGTFTVRSLAQPLDGTALKLYATQSSNSGDKSCPATLVDTFTVSPHGNSFSVPTDPGFDYYLEFADPRYSDGYAKVIRYGHVIPSPIAPCRRPFEGVETEESAASAG